MFITKCKLSFQEKKKRRMKALCSHSLVSYTVNPLVPSAISPQRVQNNAQCCLSDLLYEDANDCGSKMKWAFPEKITSFCSEMQDIADGIYVLAFWCALLISSFLFSYRSKVKTHSYQLVVVSRINILF